MQVVKRPQHLLVSHARLKIYPVQTAQPQLHFFIITSTTVVIFTTTTHSQHSLIVLSSTTGLKHTLKRTLFKRITENFQTISTYWDKNAALCAWPATAPYQKHLRYYLLTSLVLSISLCSACLEISTSMIFCLSSSFSSSALLRLSSTLSNSLCKRTDTSLATWYQSDS